MHDAPLSLLSAQPLKLIFTLLHITAALLLVYCFGTLFSCHFFCSLWALQSRSKSSAQSATLQTPLCHKQKPHPVPKYSQHVSLGVNLTVLNGNTPSTLALGTSPSPDLGAGDLSDCYLHIVPCCLSSVLHAVFQPQWGSQGSMFSIHTQSSSHIAYLKQLISHWISYSYRGEGSNCSCICMKLVFKIPLLTVSLRGQVTAGRKHRTQNRTQFYLQHTAKTSSNRIAEPTVGWVVW